MPRVLRGSVRYPHIVPQRSTRHKRAQGSVQGFRCSGGPGLISGIGDVGHRWSEPVGRNRGRKIKECVTARAVTVIRNIRTSFRATPTPPTTPERPASPTPPSQSSTLVEPAPSVLASSFDSLTPTLTTNLWDFPGQENDSLVTPGPSWHGFNSAISSFQFESGEPSIFEDQ